jgi:CheY-like chemotaxis protein
MTGSLRLSALVAAHDRWTRESVAGILADAGFEVEQASNGGAALRIASRDEPCLVVISQDLAEIGTVELVSSLRADPHTRHAALIELSSGAARHSLDASLTEAGNAVAVLAAVLTALEVRQGDPAAAPMRSVSTSPWGTWPLLSAALSHSTSRIRNAGRSGKWRLRSGIETL